MAKKTETTAPARVMEVPTANPRSGKALNQRQIDVAKALNVEGGAHVRTVAEKLEITSGQVRGAIDGLRRILGDMCVLNYKGQGKTGFFVWNGTEPVTDK